MKIKKILKSILGLKIFSPFYKLLNWYLNFYVVNVFLISYPKTGRTWLRTILGRIFSKQFNLSFTLEILALTRKMKKVPNIAFTHANFNAEKLDPKYILKFKKKRIIFLVRDPRDVVVSSYFQHTKRERVFLGTISEFIRHKVYGIERIINYYNFWYQRKNFFRDFLLIKYENLHFSPEKEIRKILKFLNLNFIRDEIIEDAISFSSFDKMREIEKRGIIENQRLKPADPKDIESYKTREGKVGEYIKYLTKEDIKFVNEKIKKLLPDFGYKT